MKVEKRTFVILGFVIALAVFLLIIFIITGFNPNFKDIITAIYFAIWVAAAFGISAFFIYPYIKERSVEKRKKDTLPESKKDKYIPSPHLDLPLRDRIRLYVTERRESEGLFVPEPLLISKVAPASTPYGSIISTEDTAKVPDASEIIAEHDFGDSELPLPDDFDDMGGGDSLPDDFDKGEDEGGFSLPDLDDEEKSIPRNKKEDEIESDSFPDFESDSDSFESDSDLNDSLMDLTDVEQEPEEDSQDVIPDLQDDESGDELPDIDEIELDEDVTGIDFSGDDDLTDIEFEDLEPDDK